MIQESLFVGIDASKLRFDGYVHPSGTRLTSGSSAREIAALTRRIAALAPTAVGLEASGGYERRLADSLLIPREAAPAFRNEAAPLFRELLAPLFRDDVAPFEGMTMKACCWV